MNDMNHFDLPPPDDNQPPVELGELPSIDEIIASLEINYSAELARAREIVEKAPKYFVITNDAEDAAATEFLVVVRTNYKTSEAGRVKEKAPYFDRDGAIHGWFKTNILDPIGLGPTNSKERFNPLERPELGVGPRINMAQTIYKTAKMEAERKAREEEAKKARELEAAAERARQAAAEAARKAQAEAEAAAAAAARKRNTETKAQAEAAAAEAKKRADEAAAAQQAALLAENKAAEERAAAEAAANAKAADLTRSRGGRGGVASLKEFVTFRDVNRKTLDLNILAPYFKEEHIEMAIRTYAAANKATVDTHLRNHTQPISGVTFYLDHKSAGRA
jgi:chemotaxis protein histidine kinase CheA